MQLRKGRVLTGSYVVTRLTPEEFTYAGYQMNSNKKSMWVLLGDRRLYVHL